MERRPTRSEVEILGVLWRQGPSSVREVHEVLSARKETGYTTVLKLMQIMAEKGLVVRNSESRAHVYSANLKESDVQQNLVDELVERVFGGSAFKLALHALSSRKSTPQELEEIRLLVEQLESQSDAPKDSSQ
jgi:BlaI family penicillinase repressor